MAKILITGASGGFGQLTVAELVRKGHAVVATMRDPAGRNQKAAQETTRVGAQVVEMDVTRDESVSSGVKEALARLGGLDVVINNAGVGVLGAQEAFTPEDWKKVFEINVFGVQRVNRAVLPTLRAQHSGLLVHISSLLGRIAIPFYGPYIATKWALEAMAEIYRVELSTLGIDVVIVEPGGFPTTFVDNLVRPSDPTRTAGYDALPIEAEGFLKGFEQTMAANPAQDPHLVAEAIARVIDTPAGQRPFRTEVDNLGMGAAVKPYNEHLAKLTAGLYAAFHLDPLLKLKTQG